LMIWWDFCPRMLATTPTPQLSCSCSGEYSPGCEAGISPFALDIDWSLCQPDLRSRFNQIASNEPIVTEKDRFAMSVTQWAKDARSENFLIDDRSGARMNGGRSSIVVPEQFDSHHPVNAVPFRDL
jgi:hypothetical protein